jgi:hypothetical protein
MQRYRVSNCQSHAWREYWRVRYPIWKAAGFPRHSKPWVKLIGSESKPHWVLHAQVGGSGLPAMEFVPVERMDVPWYLSWKRIRFLGFERPAEFPNTEPIHPGDL